MPTLYWGGGSGTWDATTATRWYTDLARTTLSTVAPCALDDVVFDSASNATAYTVTLSGAVNTGASPCCRSITISGPASGNVTIAGSGALFVYGDFNLPATGLTLTFTGSIYFYGSGNITTNGFTLSSQIFFSGTGTYTLQDAFNIGTSVLNVESGTFDTNGKNLTCGLIVNNGATSATLTLGASTVSAQSLNISTLTVNAGTSNITLSNTNAQIGLAAHTGNTFYNVTFSSSSFTQCLIYGNNTFNNLTFPAITAAAVRTISLFGNQTINGTLTLSGQSSVNRYFIRSNIIGTTRTITANAVGSLTDVDFRDISVSGTSSPWSGTRLGDCGGNTNITFSAAKTVYWNLPSGGTWQSNGWATSSGGSVSTANFPLAQDTAIIDDTGLNTSAAITGGSNYHLGTLTSTRTNAWTFTTSLIIYGDLTLTTSTTASSSSATFAGRGTQNVTSAGASFNNVVIGGHNSTVFLVDNAIFASLNLSSGGFNTNDKSLTATFGIFNSGSVSSQTFTITLGSSTITTAGFGAQSANAPAFTLNAGTSSINSSAVNIGFFGQTVTWNNVTFTSIGGTSNIYGNNTFNNLTFTSPTSTTVSVVQVWGDQTVNGTLAFGGGTSAVQRFGFYSDTIGTQRTITAATVTGLINIDFRDINGAGTGTWTGGTRIGNCGGNTGIGFDAAKTVYWNLAGTNNWSATGWAASAGGTPAVNNFPLAQDTAIVDTAATQVTLNSTWNIGSLQNSGVTIAYNAAVNVYGDWTCGSSGIGATAPIFCGRNTQTLTAGSVLFSITIDKPTGTLQLGAAFSGGSITVTRGGFNTQNYTMSIGFFTSNSGNTRSITLGTSTITSGSGGSVTSFNFSSTNLTFSAASSTIVTGTGITFSGGGLTFGTVRAGGNITIIGNNTFGTLTSNFRSNLTLAAGSTQTIASAFTWGSATTTVIRFSSTIPGQQATIAKTGAGVGFGVNSTDGGNNTNIFYLGTQPNYVYVKDIIYSGAQPTFGSANFFMMFMPT